MSRRPKKRAPSDGAYELKILAVSAGLFIAYFLAEGLFSYRPHPLHWLVAAGGGVIAYCAALIYTTLRRGRS